MPLDPEALLYFFSFSFILFFLTKIWEGIAWALVCQTIWSAAAAQ
jgi:hypothetical protein